jgi:hypothetical protein
VPTGRSCDAEKVADKGDTPENNLWLLSAKLHRSSNTDKN